MGKKKYGRISTAQSKDARKRREEEAAKRLLDGRQWIRSQYKIGNPICRNCAKLESECKC